MKILHTGSWCLGGRFYGHSRRAEHLHFLEWLLGALREFQPDALFVTGSVFSSPVPSAEAEAMLGEFLLRAVSEVEGLQVVLLGGACDTGARLEACSALWKLHNVYVRSTVHRLPSGQPAFEEHLLPLSRRGSEEAVCVCRALPLLRGGDYPAGLPFEAGLRFWFENLRKALQKSPFKGLPVVTAASFGAVPSVVGGVARFEPSVSLGSDAELVDLVGREVCFTALSRVGVGMGLGCEGRLSLAGSPIPQDFEEARGAFGANLVEISEESGEVETRSLAYTPLRGLETIPSQGFAASPSEVLEAFGALRDRVSGDDESQFPFLEVRVRGWQAEPDFRSELLRLSELKAVSLCRVRGVSAGEPGREVRGSSNSGMERGGGKARKSPLRLALEDFRTRFGSEMPQALVERFKKAADEAACSTEAYED